MPEFPSEFGPGEPRTWISEGLVVISALATPACHPRPQGLETRAPILSTQPEVPRSEGGMAVGGGGC